MSDDPTPEEIAQEEAMEAFEAALPAGLPKFAARVTDPHICPMVDGVKPHVGGPITKGALKTVICGLPAARVGDIVTCVGPPDTIAMGSSGVFIEGMPAARALDQTMHGGAIVMGAPTVFIGETGSGGGSGGGGGGAGGSGAASSGAEAEAGAEGATGGGSSNGPFATQDEAARAALDAANPQSIKDNREYSGLIYRDSKGQYYYTGPAKGSATGANPYGDAPAPPGTQVVGDYHTHGDYSTADASGNAVRTNDPSKDAFNSDNFSTSDKTGIASDGAGVSGYAGYLGTPSGTYRKYNPATGNDTVF